MDTAYQEAIKRIQTIPELSYQSRLLIEQVFKQGYEMGWQQRNKEVEESRLQWMTNFLNMSPSAQQMMVSCIKAFIDFSIKPDEKLNVSEEELSKQREADLLEGEKLQKKTVNEIVEESTSNFEKKKKKQKENK